MIDSETVERLYRVLWAVFAYLIDDGSRVFHLIGGQLRGEARWLASWLT